MRPATDVTTTGAGAHLACYSQDYSKYVAGRRATAELNVPSTSRQNNVPKIIKYTQFYEHRFVMFLYLTALNKHVNLKYRHSFIESRYK